MNGLDGFVFEIDGEIYRLNLENLMNPEIYESLSASAKALSLYLVS